MKLKYFGSKAAKPFPAGRPGFLLAGLAPLALLLAASPLPAQEPADAGAAEIDWVSVAIQFSAGLSLFLYGVTLLSQCLREVAGDRMRRVLEGAARNRVAGVATGTAATFILDSSSVTIIILIATVNAGLLSFAHVIPVIMGSNIGTTLSSQIYALNVEDYAPVAMIVGLVTSILPKAEVWRKAGLILFGLGLIFFGLSVIGDSVKPLEDHPGLLRWMERMETPLLGALAGCVATLVIQSSSATMGIVIALASQGLISLPAGVAMMLGAEIGTCADTLIATIGRSRPAVRAGLFHLLFNIATVALGLLFVHQLTGWAAGTADGVPRQIANAHVAFNVLGTLLFLPFTATIAQALERVIPDRPPEPATGRVRAAAE
ncbi:Na/Pi symporter [Azospirillum sp. SYSU D00513]|uniref:Na/Pi cotransporter family protein n=1 Tax=Azospirillum sp. SYSU D00513 TaxID=2812561 RepID=UPI001A97BB8F|nr:Na/Pi symporter [Azospirillum sp. SYSU D00513]